jgi:hypothetical protein
VHNNNKEQRTKAANNDDPRRLLSRKWVGAAISVPGLGCLIGGNNDSKKASTAMFVKKTTRFAEIMEKRETLKKDDEERERSESQADKQTHSTLT